MRYAPVARMVRRTHSTDALILEVGANENGIARFVRGRIVAVDVSADHLRAARNGQGVAVVVADAAALPFANGTFAASVCMDTLEHIPETNRARVCDELVRTVTHAGFSVVAFPSGSAAERAEISIRSAHARFTGGSIPWLDEHEEEGLPDSKGLAEHLLETVDDTRVVSETRNANVYVWRAMWRVLACGWPGRGNAVFQAAVRFLTPLLTRIHFGPCYRSMIWITPRS
jgi:ubiquinone/menaquinone biosynthesis C-methylase UbiE